MKLILKDESEIVINDFTSNSFIIPCETFLTAVQYYNTIAATGNLDKVSIVNDDGDSIYSAEGLVSDGVQITPVLDGTFIEYFYYHGAKAISEDSEYAEIGRILLGEE